MNACLQARIPQEVKDSMVGHKRQGARENYGLTEQTIKSAYVEAFKYLTINGFGQTSRKVEELQQDFQKTKNELVELITELRNENKTLKAQLESNSHTLGELTESVKQIKKTVGIKDPFKFR